MEKRSQIVILAAGDVPSHPVPLSVLDKADFVVCCDSAYHKALRAGIALREYIVIGDGDSLPSSEQQALGNRWVHISEQDYNDLHKAMRWATGRFPVHQSRFTILGATGCREDHTLGNIAYLSTFVEEYPGIAIEMITDHGIFTPIRRTTTFPSFRGQQVSIFSLSPTAVCSSEGLAYPFQRRTFRQWWEGTLNESQGNTFTISVDSPSDATRLLVFQTHGT